MKHELITLEDERKYKEFFVEGLKQQARAIDDQWDSYQGALGELKLSLVAGGEEQIAAVESRVEELVKSIQLHGEELKQKIESNTQEEVEKLDRELDIVECHRQEITSLYAKYDSKVLAGIHQEDIAMVDLSKMKEMMLSLDFTVCFEQYLFSTFEPDSFNFSCENVGNITFSPDNVEEPVLPKIVATSDTPYLTDRRIISMELDASCNRDQFSLCGEFIAITGYKDIIGDNSNRYCVKIHDKSTLLPLWDHQIGEGVGYGAIDTGICMGKVDGEVYLFVSYRKMQQIEVWKVGDKSLVSSYVFQNNSDEVDLFRMECKNNKLYFIEGYFATNAILDDPDDPLITFQSMSINSTLTLEPDGRIKTTLNRRKSIQGFCVANVEGKDVFIVSTKSPDDITAFDEKGNNLWSFPELDAPASICWDEKYLYVYVQREKKVYVLTGQGLDLLTLHIPMGLSLDDDDIENGWGEIKGLAFDEDVFGVFLSVFQCEPEDILKSNALYMFTLNYTKVRGLQKSDPADH